MAGLLTCSDFACLLFSCTEKMTYAVQNLSYRNLQLGTQFRICTGFPFQFYPQANEVFLNHHSGAKVVIIFRITDKKIVFFLKNFPNP